MLRPLLALVTLGLFACSTITFEPSPANTPTLGGPLGEVDVMYLPVSDADELLRPSVDGGAPPSRVLAGSPRIGRGATFRLVPDDHGTPQEAVILAPVQATRLRLAPDGRAQALEEGSAGVLVKTTDGTPVDLVNLAIVPVAWADIAMEAAEPNAPLHVGDRLVLAARSLDQARAPLVGTFGYTWTSSDAGVLELSPTGPDPGARRVATARAPGRVRVSIAGAEPALNGASSTLELEVQP